MKRFFAICLILFSSLINAQDIQWQSLNGPYFTPNVRLLYSAPDGTVYGFTGNGLYRSKDNGANWLRVHDIGVRRMAIDKEGRLYIAGGKGLLYFSDDEGQTIQVFENASLSSVLSSSERIMDITAKDSCIYLGTSYGLKFSIDYGVTWHATLELIGFDLKELYHIAVSPNGYVFMGNSHGLFRSTNKGFTIESLYKGISGETHPFKVHGTFVNDQGHIFVISTRYWANHGFHKGLVRSTDNGDTWEPCISNKSVQWITLDDEQNLYAGTSVGIFRSTDNGNTWKEVNNGLDHTTVYNLVYNSNDILVAGTNVGVYVSSDKGNSWNASNQGLIEKDKVGRIAIDNQDNIFASTMHLGLLRSKDKGESWTSLDSPGFYTMVENDSGYLFKAARNDIYLSKDGGDSWLQIYKYPPYDPLYNPYYIEILSFAIDKDQNLYFSYKHSAGGDAGGMSKLTEVNGIWNKNSARLPGQASVVYNVAINQLGHIYALAYFYPYKSTDFGQTFEKITSISTGNAIGFNQYGHVFFSSGNRTFRSKDEGETWENVYGGGFFQMVMNEKGHLFLMSYSVVFCSIDDGDSWQSIGSGIPETRYWIDIDSEGYLYVSTSEGLYKIVTSSMDFLPDLPIKPENYYLYQNYPNPVVENTTIYFNLLEPGDVDLKIFNISGQLVRFLETNFYNKGLSSVTWNGRDDFGRLAANGIYFYRLKGDGFDLKKKMMLIR